MFKQPRTFPILSGQASEVTLGIKFVAGASGALPALSAFLPKIAGNNLDPATTKVASSTGLYDFFLANSYQALRGWNFNVIQASYSASGACKGHVTVDSVGLATPKVRVTFYTAAGAAVDLASGDKVYGEIVVATRNS